MNGITILSTTPEHLNIGLIIVASLFLIVSVILLILAIITWIKDGFDISFVICIPLSIIIAIICIVTLTNSCKLAATYKITIDVQYLLMSLMNITKSLASMKRFIQ